MKTNTLTKKLALKKKTVSHLDMIEVKGGAIKPIYSLRCPPTYTESPCLTFFHSTGETSYP